MLRRLMVVAASTIPLVISACALVNPAPSEMVTKGDHAGLVGYYKGQAQELREKAKSWEMLAETYAKHPDPHGKVIPTEHAAHCRAAASAFKKAADEAEELAREHESQLPRGMVQ